MTTGRINQIAVVNRSGLATFRAGEGDSTLCRADPNGPWRISWDEHKPPDAYREGCAPPDRTGLIAFDTKLLSARTEDPLRGRGSVSRLRRAGDLDTDKTLTSLRSFASNCGHSLPTIGDFWASH